MDGRGRTLICDFLKSFYPVPVSFHNSNGHLSDCRRTTGRASAWGPGSMRVIAIYQQQIEEQKDTYTAVTSCAPPEKRVAGAESPVFRRPNHE